MKRKMSILLAAVITTSMLSSCGAKDKRAVEVFDDVTDTAEVEIQEKTIETNIAEKNEERPKETEDAAVGIIANTDVILGSDVMPVNNAKLGGGRMVYVSNMPEIHIMIPSSDIRELQSDDNKKRYLISIPGSNLFIKVNTYIDGAIDGLKNATGFSDEYVEYGRYMVDYTWCMICVADVETETAFWIDFELCDENGKYAKNRTEEEDQFAHTIGPVNIEYIKEQVSSWDQEFVPDVEENVIDDASNNDGLLECDIIPCGFYDLDGNKYVIVSTYDDDDSGECMLMFGRYDGADSPFDYYDLENVANNTYSATNWDKVSVTVTFSDGGMDLSGGTGELEEYNGHYTLQ